MATTPAPAAARTPRRSSPPTGAQTTQRPPRSGPPPRGCRSRRTASGDPDTSWGPHSQIGRADRAPSVARERPDPSPRSRATPVRRPAQSTAVRSAGWAADAPGATPRQRRVAPPCCAPCCVAIAVHGRRRGGGCGRSVGAAGARASGPRWPGAAGGGSVLRGPPAPKPTHPRARRRLGRSGVGRATGWPGVAGGGSLLGPYAHPNRPTSGAGTRTVRGGPGDGAV